jgi:metabotropic X receptor
LFKQRFQIRSVIDETLCEMCPEGTLPDVEHQQCLEIPEAFLQAGSSWAIGAMTLSTAGVVVTMLVVAVFVKHNHTPIVKAAGREVSYVLLSGILLCYLITFVLVLKPTDIVCAIQR